MILNLKLFFFFKVCISPVKEKWHHLVWYQHTVKKSAVSKPVYQLLSLCLSNRWQYIMSRRMELWSPREFTPSWSLSSTMMASPWRNSKGSWWIRYLPHLVLLNCLRNKVTLLTFLLILTYFCQVIKAVVPAKYLDDKTICHLQPSGRFVIGGPQVDITHKNKQISKCSAPSGHFCYFRSTFTIVYF